MFPGHIKMDSLTFMDPEEQDLVGPGDTQVSSHNYYVLMLFTCKHDVCLLSLQGLYIKHVPCIA